MEVHQYLAKRRSLKTKESKDISKNQFSQIVQCSIKNPKNEAKSQYEQIFRQSG